MNEMGKRIKQKRTEKGLTMEQLASALGIKASAINKYEKGIVENIKRSTIQQMALIFECDPTWLMGFDASVNESVEITPTEKEYLETFRNLDEESKRQIVLMLAFLKDQNNKK